MKIDQNIIKAVKAIGHDRIVLHDGNIYSCFVTKDTKFGDKGTKMQNAAIVYGVRNITMLGDLYLTSPYALIDIKKDD